MGTGLSGKNWAKNGRIRTMKGGDRIGGACMAICRHYWPSYPALENQITYPFQSLERSANGVLCKNVSRRWTKKPQQHRCSPGIVQVKLCKGDYGIMTFSRASVLLLVRGRRVGILAVATEHRTQSQNYFPNTWPLFRIFVPTLSHQFGELTFPKRTICPSII